MRNKCFSLLSFLTSAALLAGCGSKPLALDDRLNEPYARAALTGGHSSNPFPVDTSQPHYPMALQPLVLNLAPETVDLPGGQPALLRQDGNGYPVLVVQASFSDAWEQLLLALSSSRLQVLDNDRSQGVIVLDEVAGSVFSGIKKKRQMTLKRYQLSVTKVQQGTQVTVQFSQDELADQVASDAILQEIYSHLSQ